MNYELLNTIVILAGVAMVVYFFNRITRAQLNPKPEPKEKKLFQMKESAVYDVMIDREICEIKKTVQADKVILGRFHNGGYFANGMDMKKFSITHETPLGSIEPMMDRNQAVLNSRYPVAFLELVTLDYYMVSEVNDCTDPNFKRDMCKYGFCSGYLFMIKQFDGSDEGFIGVFFKTTKVMMQEQRENVTDSIPTLLGLVNMVNKQ